jgi:hypothetical protein
MSTVLWIIACLVCLALGTWFGHEVANAPVVDDEYTGPVSEWSGSRDE